MIEYGRAVVYTAGTTADIERLLLREYRKTRDDLFPTLPGDPEFIHMPPMPLMQWVYQDSGQPLSHEDLDAFYNSSMAAWKEYEEDTPELADVKERLGITLANEKDYQYFEKFIATQRGYVLADSGKQSRMSTWRKEVPEGFLKANRYKT